MKVMGTLDGQGALSVNDVQKLLKKTGNDLAYTTVMTVLVRLEKKGYLSRKKNGRQFLYGLKGTKGKASQNLLEKVRNALFQNERLKPILALLDSDKELSLDELRELRKQVDERLKQAERK
ncbi:MAG: BlaI/MecI/CopY family transcriptional regulator [Oligoflexia bacterium]